VVRDLVIETHGASRDDQTQTWHAIVGVPLHGVHSIPISQPRRLYLIYNTWLTRVVLLCGRSARVLRAMMRRMRL
jgi:hypothetical protein